MTYVIVDVIPSGYAPLFDSSKVLYTLSYIRGGNVPTRNGVCPLPRPQQATGQCVDYDAFVSLCIYTIAYIVPNVKQKFQKTYDFRQKIFIV